MVPPPPSKMMGRPAHEADMPSNNLWVGNLTPEVTEAELMTLFAKHGTIDSITSYSSRSYAFVYFKNLEDAKAAKETLQGTPLRGNPIKIEFAKPAKPCKSLWVAGISSSIPKEDLEKEFQKFGKIQEFKFIKDRNTAYVDYFRLEDASQALKSMNGKQIGGEQIRVDYLRSQPSRRQFQTPGLPSKVLWISYPPSANVTEKMLHNAMILFGEIERIKTFDDRNYAFVEFRSVEEARRAKEGLQGKLFGDPRISIEYSSSELAPSRDLFEHYPPIKGPRPDLYPNEVLLRPAQIGLFGHNRPVLPNNILGNLPPRGIHGPDMLMRPLPPQDSFDPVPPGPEFADLAALRKLQEAGPPNVVGGSDWRRSSPVPGIVSSSGALKPQNRPTSGWDVFDASQLERESKRSRIDSGLPPYDLSFPPKEMDDRVLSLDEQYGFSQLGDGSVSGPLASIQGKNRQSPVDARIQAGGLPQRTPTHDYIWRGIIAKGGTPVCRARCVPIGDGIGSEIPEVVNCSARTGLDMLTKHYADAVGFSIVFFLPDSEEDFASYTEFLRYLGTKNRAGVAKFDDGTTLFLVPPSDFLRNVLKVAGPERLYGVVLKFPHQIPSSTSTLPQQHHSQYPDLQQINVSQKGFNKTPQEERVLQVDYNRLGHEGLRPPSKVIDPLTGDSSRVHPVPPVQSSSAAVSQAGVVLTPELIATLASLLPSKSSGSENVPGPAGPGTSALALNSSVVSDKGPAQVWKFDHQAPEQVGHLGPQFGGPVSTQQRFPQVQVHPPVTSTPGLPAQGIMGFSQTQDNAFNLQAQGAGPLKPLAQIMPPLQGGQIAVSPRVDQQYQLATAQDALNGNALAHGTDAYKSYGSSGIQQPMNSAALSNQFHGANLAQSHSVQPQSSETGVANQVQQLQSALYSAGQNTSESEADKNERYRTTLLFAANLLSQIQQQPSGQAGQGSTGH